MRLKLKYYMRGIGIGIILTTLLLSIGNPKQKLTDQEVITKAQELGMVMGKDNNSNLEQVLDDNKPTGEAADVSVTPSAPADNVTPEPTQAPAIPTPEPTQVPIIPTVKPTVIPNPTSKPVSEKVTFTIQKGMSSGKVAALLKSIGLIDDADKFNKRVVDTGKASIINTGTYIITKGASYDDIIKVITAK